MIRILLVLVALSSTVALAQSRAPTGPETPSSAGSSRNDRSGIDNDKPVEVKSIEQVLRENPRLVANLQTMLPADLPPEQACAGFKTLEQCITAIHLAQNLKLSFADLKAKTTGKGSVGLQKAIEQMAANANAKDEMKKAKRQAADDMKGTSLFGQLSPQERRPVALLASL